MRILILNHEFPPVGGGGGGAARDVAFVLAERGHEVVILTAHAQGLARVEQIGRLKIIRLPSLRRELHTASLPAMLAYIAAGVYAGLRLLHTWRPDVIQAHFAVPAGALAYILSKASSIPYVITSHLGDVPGGVPEKTDRWFKWVYPFTPRIWRDAARVVAVSEYTRELALEHYPVDIGVIPNGVDFNLIGDPSPAIHQPLQIVFSGRFVSQKNPVRVVEVLDGLKDLDWHCAMLGDGILRAEVEREIAGRGLQDRFTLTGWLEPEQVLEQFKQSDILFMPSRIEAFPVTGVYALAAGLAIVASRVSGYMDMVEHGVNGFLCEADDLHEMQKSLRVLLASPKVREEAGRHSRRIARKFDIQSVTDQYEAMFMEVIRK